MKKLLWYRPAKIDARENLKYPGVEKFTYLFKLYAYGYTLIDRTETIKLPLMTHSLYPIPKFRTFTKSYEDICNDRAKELLEKAEKENKKLYVFYSGGIDSTLVLVSLLKFATQKQKENIVVLLNEDSISENPNFYRDYIEGKLHVEDSLNFINLLGTNCLFLTGEHNDQLFGGDILHGFIQLYGFQKIHESHNRQDLVNYYNSIINNPETNNFYAELFEKVCKKAPIKLRSNFDYFWWVTFSLRWQTFYLKLLLYTKENNLSKINELYLENNYITFFNTEDFQLWSLNNLDKRIKNTWQSYKWICKEIIYKFDGDKNYFENKVKVRSLQKVYVANESSNFLDSNFKFYTDINFADFYNPDNDFI